MALKHVRNAKARKALARIERGAAREGDIEKIARLAAAVLSRTTPKFPKERKPRQHQHPLRDEHGAYTCVGSTYEVEGFPPDERFEHVISAGQDADGEPFYTARRKWVAGISAQRGY